MCHTPGTTVAALDLLVALCSGCVLNLRLLADMLTEMYYLGTQLVLVLFVVVYIKFQNNTKIKTE